MSKKANNLIKSENGKLMSPEELFMYNEEQNLQSEIDDLEEGKLFALNTLRQEENIESEKLNYVLDKLSAAGIEVVTDKNKFKTILSNAKILQKMQKEISVEDLFISQNNENLNSEIDKITINDVNIYNKYINISKDTPFILKEFGLENYPVNIYKQKLARALFLEKEKYGERPTHGHKGEFTEKEVKEVFKNIGNPRYIFNSRKDITNPEHFYLIGVYDVFDKQGNPMMLSFHYDKNRKEIEANWITAVYGKNLNTLVNEWVKKGFLEYKNDLEIENASEEAGALYMRVSNLQKHLNDIVKQKSDYVNENDVFFYIKNEQTYGFAHNGKVYLNPDIMNSEVAVHEYTHLWDNYTQNTNPELWEKGKSILKDTYYWNEVKSDPNYADIADNDDLVLSEIHSRICGKMADAVLERIAETDGKITKDKAIDWDKETWDYIYKSLHISVNHKMEKSGNSYVDLKDFLAMPMKDLMNEKQITNNLDNNVVQKYTSNTSIDKEMNKITISDIRFLKSAGLDTDKKSLETFAFIKEYFLLNTKNLSSEEKNLYTMIALEGFNNPNSKNYSKLGEFLCGKKPENLKTRLLTLGYLKELNKKDNLNNTEKIEKLKLIKEKLMNQQNGFYSLLQNNGISKEYKAAIIERALKYELAQPQKQAILNMAYQNAKSYVTEKTNSNTYSFKRR